jgi:hypothetical protein
VSVPLFRRRRVSRLNVMQTPVKPLVADAIERAMREQNRQQRSERFLQIAVSV